MKDTKIQWHPGFVAAMNLEFAKDRKNLIFEKEYNLNTKPLEIDLLVIKKKPPSALKTKLEPFSGVTILWNINLRTILWILILFIKPGHMQAFINPMGKLWTQ